MLMHYARIWRAGGFVSDDDYRPIEKRDPSLVKLDGPWEYAFELVDREEVELNGKLLVGSWENPGPRHIVGEVFDEARVRAEVPDPGILLDNMRRNKWARVIKCAQGFLPMAADDVVIAP